MLESTSKTWARDLINGPVIWRCLMAFVDWAELDFSSNRVSPLPHYGWTIHRNSDDISSVAANNSFECLVIIFNLSDSYQQHDKPLCRITTSHVIQSLSTLLIYSKQRVPGLGLWKFLLAITFSLLAHGIVDAWATPFKASPSYSRPFTEKGEKGH